MIAICVVIAAMLSLVAFNWFWDSGVCMDCGGTGGHRKGCPRDE